MDDKKDLLVQSTDEVMSQLIESQDSEEIKRLTQLFNVNQMKKDALRTIKLNDILDKLDEQVSERVSSHPDQFSNTDLLNYVNTIQQTISKTSQTLKNIDQTPLIQFNQQNNVINLDDNTLTRESREKILNAVQQLLDYAEKENIVDVTEDSVVYYDKEDSNDTR